MVTRVDWIFPFSNVSWQFGTWIVGGGGPVPPGTGVDVYENGLLVKAAAFELNFMGAVDVTPGVGDRAHITVTPNSITGITHTAVDTAMTTTDDTLVCDTVFGALLNITLPAPATIIGKEIRIKNNGYGMLSLIPAAPGQLIEGADTYLASSPFEALRLQTDGTNWYII
jgi:hypothetical protein